MSFERLSPALQYQIVNALGFQSLRPVQNHAIPPIMDGANCVILAPTAGGKTEAAFFPLLSMMDSEDWRATSVIYVSPIRALINNQAPRIERYAGLIGRRSALRHGDVTQRDRSAYLREPTDFLLTTPESLEVMLMSSKVPSRELFRGLQAVVIDEIHAFVGDDRGGHLAAVLERLSRFAGRDLQRIGLSATVGNPDEILGWMAGSSERPGQVVNPGGGGPPELTVDYVGNLNNAARVVAQLHRGKKRLVFVDSRRKVEALGQSLRELGVETFLLHSSLSRAERTATEKAFSRGSNRVIVSTSALELGVDIGDLDHVLQIDAPSTVAGFIQRLGRTGRREGTQANCTFLATKEPALIQAAAIVELYEQGYVEPVRPVTKAAHLLAHQLIALAFQQGSVLSTGWFPWVGAATPFADFTPEERDELVAHMLEEKIIVKVDARYWLGQRGHQLYGHKNFMELYSVFSTPMSLTVEWAGTEIGTLEASFVAQHEIPGLTFTLAGQGWIAQALNWRKGVLYVEPMDEGILPRWRGTPRLLERRLCETIRALLVGDHVSPTWTERARNVFEEARVAYGFLNPEGMTLVPHKDGGATLWTFAGGRANNLLARCVEEELHDQVSANNLSLRLPASINSLYDVTAALDRLRAADRPTDEDAARLASGCTRVRLSKFQPCLPPRMEQNFLARSLTDPAEARATLNAPVTMVTREAMEEE